MNRSERREQVVQATLELLATHPPDRITTRLIAARIGVSQPALFRHFDDRDEILAETVAWTRGQLERGALAALQGEGDPLDRVGALVRGLGAFAARWPGLPRLLFADVVKGEGEGWALGLRGVVAAQRAVVAGLVRDAMREGTAPAGVDPDRAARLLVAGLQGLLLQAGLEEEPPDMDALVAHWRAGVLAGQPPAERVAVGLAEVDLDVRPILSSGRDPLADVLAATDRLAPGGRLRLVAPFQPTPLVALLERRGFAVTCDGAADGTFVVTAVAP